LSIHQHLVRVCEDKSAHLIHENFGSVIEGNKDAPRHRSHFQEDICRITRQAVPHGGLYAGIPRFIYDGAWFGAKISRDLVAKQQSGISVVTIQDTEVVSWNFGLVKNARDDVVRIRIQREDESLNEPLRETVDKAEEKKSDGETSERNPKVDGFDGYPAASRKGQHPGDLEC